MQEVSCQPGRYWNRRTALLLALLAAAIVFLPCLGAGFLPGWDDDAYILNNPLVKEFSPESVKRIFTSLHRGLYKPLTMFLFSAEYAVAGPNPAVFHAVNLFLHLANCALVFRVAGALAGGVAVPFITALFFGIHPMHVESVAWITECKDLLYTFFFLSSLLGYLKYRETGSPVPYLLSMCAFALSLMAKPMGITLPLVLLLMDYARERKADYGIIRDKLPYAALAALFLLGALFSIGSSGAMFNRNGYSALDDITVAFSGLALYTARAFLPLNLSPIYPYPVKAAGLLPSAYYLAPLACVLLFGSLLYIWRRDRALIFGLAFYLLTIAPGLQWLQVAPSIAFDHYSYIAYIGIFYIAGTLTARFLGREPSRARRATVIAICVLSAAFYGRAAYARCQTWKTPFTLWNDMLSKYPGNPSAMANRSFAYLASGDYRSALRDINSALKTDPGNADYLKTRAACLSKLGQEELARQDLADAIALSPSSPELYMARGISFSREGRYEEGMKDFRAALNLGQDNALARLNLGWTLSKSGKQEEALAELNKALALNGTLPDALLNRAAIYMASGKPKEAVLDIENALRHGETSAKASALLGAARLGEGQPEGAAKAFADAVAGDPSNPDYLHGYGMALMTAGKLAEAEEAFSSALAARPNEAKFYGARGTCALMAGKYSEAERDLSNSLALAPDNPAVLNNRASAYEKLERPDKALADYNTALKADSSYEKARLNKVLLLLRAGEEKQACREAENLPPGREWSGKVAKQFPGACKK